MVAWPDETILPDFLRHRISIIFGDGRKITPTDSGKKQAFLISSNPPHILECSADYTGGQCLIFQNFYFNDLKGGILQFTHPDFFTNFTRNYEFKKDAPPPSFSHIISGKDAKSKSNWYWKVDFTLEQTW